MLNLQLIDTDPSEAKLSQLQFNLQGKSLQEEVKLSILHDLWNLNWQIDFNKDKIEVIPPEFYDKEIIREAMSFKRNEILLRNKNWIDINQKFAMENLADGHELQRHPNP